MKLKTIFILCVVLIASLANAADVRNASWGMSRDEVRACEVKGKFATETDDALVYEVDLAGKDCFLVYKFRSNGLYNVFYSLNEKYVNDNRYYEDFKMFFKKLMKKYGDATDSRFLWSQDLYRDDPAKKGFAISIGHYSEFFEWEYNETIIKCLITGENYEIKVFVDYSNPAFAMTEEAEAETLEDF